MTATATERAAKTQKEFALTPEKFSSQTAVLLLEQRKPGFSRQVPTNDVVDPNDPVSRTMLTVTKRLLNKKVLRPINREDSSIKQYLERRAAYCSMLARGMWAIPLGVLEEVDEELAGYKARRNALVRQMIEERYEDAVAQARQDLGKHFRADEYPTKEELANEFAVSTRWLTFNVPSALQAASEEIYQRETARLSVEIESAGEEIKQAYREAFAELIEHVADRLGADATSGKPNTFRDSTIEKLQDFLRTFGNRNIMNDVQLAALAEQARAVLNGSSIEKVRSDVATRARVLTAMQEIKGKLSGMQVAAPAKRRLMTDEEV